MVFLTGRGLSAESNIPNFLEEGHPWPSKGSVHSARSLARHAAFVDDPDVVWGWYLWRWAVCQSGKPNPAHRAITRASRLFEGRIRVITEAVDGLHRLAQSPLDHTYEVHGYVGAMRCAGGCVGLSHVPRLPPHPHGVGELTGEEQAALVCVRCGGPARPHVLWLDETYDESNYRADTALQAAATASALIVVGSAGAGQLSRQVFERVAERRVPVIVVTPELNDLARMAARLPAGIHLRGTASDIVPMLVEDLAKAAGLAEPTAGRHRGRDRPVEETILKVGAEGGCMTLIGRQSDDGRWRFRVNVDASTFAEFMPDEFSADQLRRDGEWIDGFDAALEAFDQEVPWAQLSPIRVHPEFAGRVIEAVRNRLRSSDVTDHTQWKLERWTEVCAGRR
jgi:NAD-dependent deacetylase